MEVLLSALEGLEEFEQLLTAMDNGRCPAAVSGMAAVHRAHFAAAIHCKTGRSVVLVCADESEADRLARERRANPTAELDSLRAEVEQLKTAAAVRDIRDKVAGEKSVPAKLLTGSTEAECTAQADAILAFAAQQQGKPYPAVQDGGEVGKNGSGGTTRDHFAEWFAANIK